MFRKALSVGGVLLLAGATVVVTPGSSQAQHRGGGGHGGGFHGGGFRGGSFNHGSFHGGGFRGGSFNHGSFHHGGFHHGGFHHGSRGWYPGYYGYYGGWPNYYGSYPYGGYSDYYPSTYSSDWSSPAYNSGYYPSNSAYYPSYGSGISSYPDSYAPATAQAGAIAHVTVSVPADAEIWFDGSKTTSTGSVREYQSPALTPGNRYAYEVRARWYENGQEVTQTQQVQVTAGSHVNVQFPVQPTNAATARRR